MSKRERRAFGSVRRLSSGRWQVRYRDLSGVLHTGPHTFTSKADATRYLAMVEADLHRGAWADPKLGRITLGEWAKRWQATTTNLRPTTRDLYAYLLRRFLLPTFGKAALSSIDVLAVRAWLADLQAQQLSPSTVAKAYRLLSRILGAAVEAGYLPRNPCTVKGAGQERAPEMRFATVAQVAALADDIGPRYRALVLVAAYGGLRWGELVGLRVKRVDLLHGRVTVAEQVAEVNGQLLPGPPKTEAGRRTVTLPAVAAVALAEHLATFAEPAPRGWCSRPHRAGICAGRTSVVAGGCRPRERLEWRGYGFTICPTRPPPWHWRLGRTPGS
jgi:integrase